MPEAKGARNTGQSQPGLRSNRECRLNAELGAPLLPLKIPGLLWWPCRGGRHGLVGRCSPEAITALRRPPASVRIPVKS